MILDIKNVYPDLLYAVDVVFSDMWNITGQKLRITCGYRSMEEQANLYAIGRTRPGKIITNAPPGNSWHEYGLAVDVAFQGSDPYLNAFSDKIKLWTIFCELSEKNGLIWGGRFKRVIDMPHVQWPVPFGIHDAMLIKNESGIKGVWESLKIGRDMLT